MLSSIKVSKPQERCGLKAIICGLGVLQGDGLCGVRAIICGVRALEDADIDGEHSRELVSVD